ncbi:acyltransferase domain-containing protein [Actinomadura montaniterrae]|uniref:Acyltransferase domain-containing protein n=2 Tax=Actinomadura montaniterrae TaxID=1803903 RepID=A0A6L3W8Y9_9ACTN|nr:acyltransferase domain-containing protein [Actinomadura montaniterrae]
MPVLRAPEVRRPGRGDPAVGHRQAAPPPDARAVRRRRGPDGRRAMSEIVFLFPGQGAQHPGMARELFGREPVFTEILEEFFELLDGEGKRLRDDWLTDDPAVPLDEGRRAQPLLFILGYALARTLETRGVRPGVLLGHSIGELAAAAFAGVFDLPAAARLMEARSLALDGSPSGGMLAVGATPEELTRFVDPPGRPGGVVVGAVNAPRQTVLAGPEPRLGEVERALEDAGTPGRRVPALQAFHSPAMAEAAEVFTAAFAKEELRRPSLRIQSTRTARAVRPDEATDPGFWAGQVAGAVLFWPALEALLAEGDFTLVEVGPGRRLSTPARRHPAVRSGRSTVIPMLPSTAEGTWEFWTAALDALDALP